MNQTELLQTLSIAATIWVLVSGIGKFLYSYLESKFLKVGSRSLTASEQSAQCHYDHSKLTDMLAVQNDHIAKLLEQNGKQIELMSNASHAAELRHQIYIGKMDIILERLPR